MTQCSELRPRLILPPPPPLLCTKLSDLAQVTTLAFIFLICEMGLIMPAFPISYRNGQSEITLKKTKQKTNWKVPLQQGWESGRGYHWPSVMYQEVQLLNSFSGQWRKGISTENSEQACLFLMSSRTLQWEPWPWRLFLALPRPPSLASAEDAAEQESDGPPETSLQGAEGHLLLSWPGLIVMEQDLADGQSS